MRVFHIVGYSNVGKTRLIESLCQHLNGRVLVLKFSHHSPSDRPGSDTDRFAAYRADTLLIQPNQTTWRSSLALPIDWPQVAQHFEWMIWEGVNISQRRRLFSIPRTFWNTFPTFV